MKAIALIALTFALEAGFLWQVTVIARPERRSVTMMAIAHEPSAGSAAAGGQAASVAQYDAPVVPRS